MSEINSNMSRGLYRANNVARVPRGASRDVKCHLVAYRLKKNPESFRTRGDRSSQKTRVSYRGEMYRRKIRLDFNDDGTRRVVIIDLPDPRIPTGRAVLHLATYKFASLSKARATRRRCGAFVAVTCARTWGPRVPRVPRVYARASIHAAKQIRRLGIRNKRRRGDAV